MSISKSLKVGKIRIHRRKFFITGESSLEYNLSLRQEMEILA